MTESKQRRTACRKSLERACRGMTTAITTVAALWGAVVDAQGPITLLE
jgi:hypothetical protein